MSLDGRPRSSSAQFDLQKLAYLQSIRMARIVRPDAPGIYREFVSQLDAAPHKSVHYIRYCQTFMATAPYLGDLRVMKVLQAGSFCAITRFLASRGADCRNTSTDLRYEIDAGDSCVDLLLSLEVIEHLKDRTEETLKEIVLFRGSGARQYAAETIRVLKPGGHLILTTPNPCSALVLSRLIKNKPPMVFRPHVREYTREELIELFTGLDLIEATTHYSFFLLREKEQANWESVFKRNGWDHASRGDDHFIVFRKPAV